MNPVPRKLLLRGLLWLPVVLVLVWSVNQERMDDQDARTQVADQARHIAMAEGQLIQLRLMQQFLQLGFVAKAIVGGQDPETLDTQTQTLLDRFAAQHPELFALNIQSADGQRILWSSHPQPATPMFGTQDFTPLPGRPDDLLGRSRYAPRYGGLIQSMRYRMRDAQGRTLYFVGSPYRVDALLASTIADDWLLTVRDLRDDSVLGALSHGRVVHPTSMTEGGVEEPINGLPLAVAVGWPSAKVWQLYRHGLEWRLAARAIVLAFFILAALVVGRLLRSRQDLLQRNARLARFNAMLAHVNQAIVQTSDVPNLLETVCRLAVHDLAVTLAWVGRPGDDGRFVFLAKAGPAAGYVDGLVISADGSTPEGRDSAAMVWREDRAVFTIDTQGSASWRPWRERLQRFELNAAAGLPLHRSGKIWAVLNIYCEDSTSFTPDLQRTLLDLASDLSHGLDRLDLLRSQALLQRQHASLLSNTVAGMVMVRYPGATIVEANAAIARVFGIRDVSEVLGRNVGEAAPSLIQDAMVNATRVALKDGQVEVDALDIVRADGQPACIAISGRRIDTDPEGFTFVVWTAVDVTERQRLMHQMEQLSQADPLTGLPNRRALEQYLEHSIVRAGRLGAAVAVGLIDLDDFKPVNDRYGHGVGDRLLKQLGERLRQLMRGSDMIARLGGDEFVVVIEDLDVEYAQAQLGVILGRLHQAVQTPFDLGDGRTASVGMSMGVALTSADGSSADTLVRLADGAMYRIKARKATRTQWWTLAGVDPGDDIPDPPFDPFGSDAQALLGRIGLLLDITEREFVEPFYNELAQRSDTAAILAALSVASLARLKLSQAAHLRFLLDPATTAAQIQARAQHLGRLHALVGVAPSWLSASMQLYRDLLHWHLDAGELAARERYRLQRVFDARVQIDLQCQLDAMLLVQNAYNAYLARALPRLGQAWVDVIDAKLQALGALPGIRCCALLRPDAQGLFIVQASGGALAADVAQALSTPGLQPSLDANSATGNGMAAQAWRTESIMTAKGYESCLGLAPWERTAARFGIRSMAAIPLMRAGQTDSVLVLYGAYPNQFDTQQGRTFLAAAQNRWNLIDDLLRQRHPVVDQQDAALYRQWLYADGLHMFVQPVVDLRDGRLSKVEALARLVSPEGDVVAPGLFLPALREADLDSLFRRGLSQSLRWLAQWHDHGLKLDVSLNLPPSTLLHPDCAQWIREALRDHGIAPHHLVLELLESQEVDEALRDKAIATLGRLGVHLAIDDLGSGFSSLKRLASLPFDVIKIDQGIIQDIDRDPIKALSLVRTVVQIGRDFEKEVVVEGVENAAIIEAVTILGATFGQGYGIARPMPAKQLQDWAAQYALNRQAPDDRSSPTRITSALGALAYHWLDAHDGQQHQARAIEACPLTTFLQACGAGAEDARTWHATVHAASDADVRKAVSKKLTAWLAELVGVRQAASHRALSERTAHDSTQAS